ncbi:hypothetical protein L484_021288 [Morus notabilis]|uniref:Uncharacterized protein n=1 Tax=Morus notabilis TaxID=981085 RepID=W9SG47_9ROSA|nr:hypothetical protein L484_021288 [Morus notabilis]
MQFCMVVRDVSDSVSACDIAAAQWHNEAEDWFSSSFHNNLLLNWWLKHQFFKAILKVAD